MSNIYKESDLFGNFKRDEPVHLFYFAGRTDEKANPADIVCFISESLIMEEISTDCVSGLAVGYPNHHYLNLIEGTSDFFRLYLPRLRDMIREGENKSRGIRPPVIDTKIVWFRNNLLRRQFEGWTWITAKIDKSPLVKMYRTQSSIDVLEAAEGKVVSFIKAVNKFMSAVSYEGSVHMASEETVESLPTLLNSACISCTASFPSEEDLEDILNLPEIPTVAEHVEHYYRPFIQGLLDDDLVWPVPSLRFI